MNLRLETPNLWSGSGLRGPTLRTNFHGVRRHRASFQRRKATNSPHITESHEQSKCRTIEPSSNGNICSTTSDLRLRDHCRKGCREIVGSKGTVVYSVIVSTRNARSCAYKVSLTWMLKWEPWWIHYYRMYKSQKASTIDKNYRQLRNVQSEGNVFSSTPIYFPIPDWKHEKHVCTRNIQ